ncbi:hypothetical protein [Hymenobacter algoricola]|uniref:Uncharacterized protein n=1 Tax=Hymenobacter algoricola TaxID=486267 RepID=A0ABP7NU62_9BACT
MAVSGYQLNQVASFVEEWVVANPSRLPHLHGDIPGFIKWQAAAVRRIMGRDALRYSGTDILEEWATEAEAAQAIAA